ncbi:MAG TPA: alpha/beta fold hydrolase, partial [Methylomirabilota bacterium]|nr:alpha/beta fold hydrolase [Methylomirabilota bacterium]
MPCGTPRTLRVNGLALAVSEWGSEGPPLFLLHSLAAHSHWWDWTALFWAAQHRVVALDFRGHGGSAHVAPPAYGFDEHAADVVGALDALGFERPVVIGHSMGGYVGALLAARRPERMRALVIADMLTEWTAAHAAMAERQAGRAPAEFASAAEAGSRFR